jgi:hypothetical protein
LRSLTRTSASASASASAFAKAGAALSLILASSFVTAGCGSPDRPASWAYISPVILQPSCASGSCHSPAAAAAGLDFSDPDRGYSSLTRLWVWIVDRTKEGTAGCSHASGTVVCEELFRPLVTPYDPAASRLIAVLRGRNAPRMPPDRPLDEADIRLIENWILDGAKKSEREPFPADAAPPVELPPDASVDDAAGDARPDGGDASSDVAALDLRAGS